MGSVYMLIDWTVSAPGVLTWLHWYGKQLSWRFESIYSSHHSKQLSQIPLLMPTPTTVWFPQDTSLQPCKKSSLPSLRRWAPSCYGNFWALISIQCDLLGCYMGNHSHQVIPGLVIIAFICDLTFL